MGQTGLEHKALSEFARQLTQRASLSDLNAWADGTTPPLVDLLKNHFASLRAPHSFPKMDVFGNNQILAFSDYSGDSKADGAFRTYGFLFCAAPFAHKFSEIWRPLRKASKLGARTINYKSLRNDVVVDSLPRFLANADNILNGYLFVLAVDKRIDTLFGQSKNQFQSVFSSHLSQHNLLEWKVRVLEDVITVSHLLAGLHTLLSPPSMKLTWFTDNDRICANEQQFSALASITNNLLYHYNCAYPSQFSLGCKNDLLHTQFVDLMALPDLACGTVNEVLSRKYTDANDRLLVKNGSHYIAEWLGQQGLGLRKSILKIYPGKQGELIGSTLSLRFSGNKKIEMPSVKITVPKQ